MAERLAQMKVAVILPAAGSSRRFAASGSPRNKLELELNGRPVLLRSVMLFAHRPEVVQVIVAAPPDGLDEFKMRWGDQLGFHGVEIVAGGRIERWETVHHALAAVRDDCTHVAVHDAARPLASMALLDRIFEAAGEHDAVIPAIDVSATLKRVAEPDAMGAAAGQDDPATAILGDVAARARVSRRRRVLRTIDRRNVVAVQTPQVFKASLLRSAYAAIESGRIETASVTDDASLVEAIGGTVWVVEGEATNLKLTQPDDVALAEAIIAKAEATDAAALGRRHLFGDDDD